MRLSRIGYNQTVVVHNDGTEVFFSYDTPVAGYHPELGYVRTKEYYSRTTSRHINKYLDTLESSKVDQTVINSLANGCYKITDYTVEQQELTTLEELNETTYDQLTQLVESDWGKDHMKLLGFEESNLSKATTKAMDAIL